jgi:very-short-patch-repair endonuclease
MKRPSIDVRIATLASRQHGAVTRAQLLEAGLTRDMVDGRVSCGRLRLLYRGVYLPCSLVGPVEPALAKVMAAVLACGPDSFASHETAGSLWKVVRPPPGRSMVHVTIVAADRGRRPGIRPHRVDVLAAEDRAVVDGVPVTAPARTLVDIASHVRIRVLEQALAEAERLGLADGDTVAAALKRDPRAHGATRLRLLIAKEGGLSFTRSAAEALFMSLARKVDLPVPETNVRVGDDEVDFLFRAEKVVVEIDGFAFHSSRRTFENDRRRDARLAVLGFRVVRVTWRQLTNEPDAVLVRLARILGAASPGRARGEIVA